VRSTPLAVLSTWNNLGYRQLFRAAALLLSLVQASFASISALSAAASVLPDPLTPPSLHDGDMQLGSPRGVAGSLAQLRGALALPATVELCALDALAAAAAGGDDRDDALAVLTAGLQVMGLMRALTPLRTAGAPSVPAALAALVRTSPSPSQAPGDAPLVLHPRLQAMRSYAHSQGSDSELRTHQFSASQSDESLTLAVGADDW
jgi:hypothetical protein